MKGADGNEAGRRTDVNRATGELDLQAFVDGELSPEEAAAIVLHLADHPADQARVDDLFAANAALAQAYGAPATERVPDAILATIDGALARAAILPFRLRPAEVVAGLALAAALVAAALLLRSPAEPILALGPVMGGSALAEAMDLLPSGEATILPDGSAMMVHASYAVDPGHCRAVEVNAPGAGSGTLALICHGAAREGRHEGWRVEVVLQKALPSGRAAGGFAARDGALTVALTPFLDERGAGPALTPAEEANAIAQVWGR